MRKEELRRASRALKSHETVGIGELCAILGTAKKPVDRNTVRRLERTDPDFPKPIQFYKNRQWFKDEVVEYKLNCRRRQYCEIPADDTRPAA